MQRPRVRTPVEPFCFLTFFKALYATIEDHKHTRFGSAYGDMLERTDPDYKSHTALANLKRSRPANIEEIGEPVREFVNWINYRHKFERDFAYVASQKPQTIFDAMFVDKSEVIREMRDNYIQLRDFNLRSYL